MIHPLGPVGTVLWPVIPSEIPENVFFKIIRKKKNFRSNKIFHYIIFINIFVFIPTES